MQKVLILKKTVHQLDLNPRSPECKSAALLYGCGFRWNVAEVFSTLISTRCRTQSDNRINSQ